MNIETSCKLVALVGGSGAGKTWLADHLRQEFGNEATSLSLDNFYRDLSHLAPAAREKINFDHPDTIDWPLFEVVLRDLQRGLMVFAPHYDFTSHARLTGMEPLMPRPLIFVEGLWLLWPPQVRALFDLRVFLNCAEALRLERRLARDLQERGRTADSIHQQFRNVVAPMNERFVEVQKDWADLVIEQPMDETGLCRLVAAVRALRTEPDPALLEIFRSQKTKLNLAS